MLSKIISYLFVLSLPTHLIFVLYKEWRKSYWDFWTALIYLGVAVAGILTSPLFILGEGLDLVQRYFVSEY